MKRLVNSGIFHFPKDGAVLTENYGKRVGDTLKIKVVFHVTNNRKLFINGIQMENYDNGLYRAYVVLDSFKNTLEIVDRDTNEKWSIDVYFAKNGTKKYRFCLDDNIFFLQNINNNKDVYKSIFEDPYLATLKKINEKHGSKFQVNIYYETPDNNGFNLSQMTDKYLNEWNANSDWLRLSFHAYADKPNRPYACASYEQAYREMKAVNDEIKRFAGKAFSANVTNLHFCETTIEATKAFRNLGVRVLAGSFKWGSSDNIELRLHFDAEQCANVRKYGFYYDKETDIFVSRFNGFIQKNNVENFYNIFDQQVKDYPEYEFKDFVLHEQYFYPTHKKHQPNYYEKMDVAATWCDEHGYTPAFMDEIFELE